MICVLPLQSSLVEAELPPTIGFRTKASNHLPWHPPLTHFLSPSLNLRLPLTFLSQLKKVSATFLSRPIFLRISSPGLSDGHSPLSFRYCQLPRRSWFLILSVPLLLFLASWEINLSNLLKEYIELQNHDEYPHIRADFSVFSFPNFDRAP